MEQVGRKGSVLFVNDSKATNADSAAQALASFTDIFWIAGGKPKTGGITSLDRLLPAHPQGLSDRRGGGGVRRRRCEGKVPYVVAGTLDRAVELAARDAAGVGREGAGGAAVAGLRVVRPVPQFRGARRRVPRRWC